MIILYEALFQQMRLVLQSKAEEFHLYGYQQVTSQQLWAFCVEKKWRKRQIEAIQLHEVVATIFSITPAEFMHYIQMQEMNNKEIAVGIISADEMAFFLK